MKDYYELHDGSQLIDKLAGSTRHCFSFCNILKYALRAGRKSKSTLNEDKQKLLDYIKDYNDNKASLYRPNKDIVIDVYKSIENEEIKDIYYKQFKNYLKDVK